MKSFNSSLFAIFKLFLLLPSQGKDNTREQNPLLSGRKVKSIVDAFLALYRLSTLVVTASLETF